tara:strand:+ start:3407 stop:4480 length:1074 start_codon:yes stop_codon:yes gene_type:complete
MVKNVVVWGTGNVGRPAIRSVVANQDLNLVGVLVSNPEKVGQDAGDLAGIEKTGIIATDNLDEALAASVDAVVYTVNADFRPMESLDEVESLLQRGINVVTTSFYPMYHPPSMPEDLSKRFNAACSDGNTSIFASGIDPGWTCDILPLLLSGVSADITEIRSQELMNYALYDQPDAVRNLVGFGMPMDQTPPMVLDFSLQMVWGPEIRILADGLGVELDEIQTSVEKRPLEKTIHVDGMGEFEEGTIGALRFEIQGIVNGKKLLVMEHITRIDDDCAPDWPYPPTGQGSHQVQITGKPTLQVTVHGEEHGERGAAGGGNGTAANRIVNAIPAVCDATPGVLHPLDVSPLRLGAQLRA